MCTSVRGDGAVHKVRSDMGTCRVAAMQVMGLSEDGKVAIRHRWVWCVRSWWKNIWRKGGKEGVRIKVPFPQMRTHHLCTHTIPHPSSFRPHLPRAPYAQFHAPSHHLKLGLPRPTLKLTLALASCWPFLRALH
jgi:hypothetical protein